MQTNTSSVLNRLHLNLDRVGDWIAPLSLRVFLAWEFFEAGWKSGTVKTGSQAFKVPSLFPLISCPLRSIGSYQCGQNWSVPLLCL